MDLLSDFLLFWEFIVVVDYLWAFSASLTRSDLPLVTRRVEVLGLVIEDETHKA